MGAIEDLEAYFAKGNERPGYIKQAGVGAPLVVGHSRPISRAYAKFVSRVLRVQLGDVVAHCDVAEYIFQVHLNACHNQSSVLAVAHALLKPVQPGVIVTLYGATNPQVATWVVAPVLFFPDGFDRAVNTWCEGVWSDGFSLLGHSTERVVGRITGTMAFFGAKWAANAFCEHFTFNRIRTVEKEDFEQQ